MHYVCREEAGSAAQWGKAHFLARCLAVSHSGILHRRPLGMSWHTYIDMGEQQLMGATGTAVRQGVIVVGRLRKTTANLSLK